MGYRYRSAVLATLLTAVAVLRAQVPAPLQQPLPPQRALGQQEEADTLIRSVPLPTEELRQTTPEQDSAYVRALRTPLTPLSRFQAALRESSPAWLAAQEQVLLPPWQSALRNLRLDPAVLVPTGEELVQHAYALQQAQALPTATLRRTPGSGVAIPLAAIAQFIGLTEDLSPTIRYEVQTVSHVQVRVYSVQALLVATLYDGVQRPGRYSLTWNGRDDQGRAVPPGDYVAEVRIGGTQRLYKRIRLGSSDIR